MNWELYDRIEEFSIDEAAHLWLNQDIVYRSSLTQRDPPDIRIMKDWLREQVRKHFGLTQADDFSPIAPAANQAPLLKITRDQLRILAKGRNEHPEFLYPEARDKRPGTSWPWGTYETPLLRDLAAAVERLWVRYDPTDPTTAPTNEQVIQWLVEKRKVPQRVAEVMARILRAENAPKGRRS